MLAAFLAVFIVASSLTPLAKAGPIVFTHDHGMYQSHYSYTCDAPRKWADGRAYCASLGDGYHMASFPTEASIQSLRSAIEVNGGTKSNTWVGGYSTPEQQSR